MMNNNKYAARLTSVILCFMLLFSAIPAMASTTEHILLNYENFNVPAYTNGGCVVDPTDATDDIFGTSFYINQDGNQRYSTARVYIEEAGTYNLWILSGYAAGADTRRAKVGFDDQTMQEATGHQNHEWDKTVWTLTKGWHDLKVGIVTAWNPTYVNALYITNDLTYVPDTATDDALLAYHDTTAPVIGDDDPVIALDGNDCVVTFPEATGNTDELILYGYTINGTTNSISDITQPVNIGQISGETTVTLTAYDKVGNSSSKDFTVEAPEMILTSDGFLLTYKNFTLPAFPAPPNGGIIGGVTGAVADSNIKVNGGDTSLYATAKFYVAVEGDYALWLYSGNQDNIAARHPVAYIDDQQDLSTFNATTTLTWNKGKGPDNSGVYHLTAGWHTVKLGLSGAWLPYLVNAVYITDDLNFEVTTANDDVLLSQQADSAAPEFDAASIDVVYTDYTTCTLNFPEIIDATGVVETAYYINNEPVAVTNGSIEITDLKPLEKLLLKVETSDKFGNKSVFEDEYLSTPVQTSSFAMVKNSETTPLEDLSTLAAGNVIKLNTKLTNLTATAKTVELAICLYSVNYERMLLCIPSEVLLSANAQNVSASVSLTLPNDFVNTSGCIVTATLWDKASGEPFVEGIEIKGAE